MGNIETAAKIITEARRAHRIIYGLPDDCAPVDIEEGYAIQKAFMDAWGVDIAGWKVGATSPQVQAMFDDDEPFYGPIFAPDLLQSPASIAAEGHHILGVESEFAFTFARDLEPGVAPGRDDIADYLGAAHIAIEFVSPRLDRPVAYGMSQLVADGAGNGAVVLGPEISNWRDLDLSKAGARILVNGEELAAGTGADVLGHPLEALAWFAARAGGHGHTIESGSIVITGTCTGLQMVEPGATVVSDFGKLGDVRLNLV